MCIVAVREKAKELAALVKDKDRVKEERSRARRVSYCLVLLSQLNLGGLVVYKPRPVFYL